MDDKLGTLHGDFRLMQRADEIDKSLTEMWDEAIDCEVKYHSYDEARVHPESDLVLLQKNGTIVTCIPETYNVTIDGDDFEEYMDTALE